MRTTVLTWFRDFMVTLIARTLEVSFRLLLLVLPLWVYLLIIQSREKVSSVSNLTVYTNDNSVWQHIFPGFILVALNKNDLKNGVLEKVTKIQNWIREYRYILIAVFCLILLALIIVGVRKCYI